MSEWNDAAADWVDRHEAILDLITVWSLVIGLSIGAVVFAVLWLVMRQQHDGTDFGKALRTQWGAMSISKVALATLYGITLYIYYQGQNPLNTWTYLLIRLVLTVSILAAALAGVRALIQLRRETRTVAAPEGGAAMIQDDAGEDGLP